MRRVRSIAAILGISVFASSESASAFDLTGASAPYVEQCGKVFAQKDERTRSLSQISPGSMAAGLSLSPTACRGKFENCSIKSRKDDGQNVNIVVSCASGIMVSNVQFFLKVIDDDSVTRLFPGIEGMEVTYHRCKI